MAKLYQEVTISKAEAETYKQKFDKKNQGLLQCKKSLAVVGALLEKSEEKNSMLIEINHLLKAKIEMCDKDMDKLRTQLADTQEQSGEYCFNMNLYKKTISEAEVLLAEADFFKQAYGTGSNKEDLINLATVYQVHFRDIVLPTSLGPHYNAKDTGLHLETNNHAFHAENSEAKKGWGDEDDWTEDSPGFKDSPGNGKHPLDDGTSNKGTKGTPEKKAKTQSNKDETKEDNEESQPWETSLGN
jgi:hypothetical protein